MNASKLYELSQTQGLKKVHEPNDSFTTVIIHVKKTRNLPKLTKLIIPKENI